jgi:hypothetical protein
MNHLTNCPPAVAIRSIELRIVQSGHGGTQVSGRGGDFAEPLLAPAGARISVEFKPTDRITQVQGAVCLAH